MARNEARQQKALMKKRQKDKLRKKKNQKNSIFTMKSSLLKTVREYPIHECLINDFWSKSGLATIIISRIMPNGDIIFGDYLVDVFCLGLKDTFYKINVPLSAYENEFKPMASRRSRLTECPVTLAHQIIYGAIDYARDIGFEPHKDFKFSKYILEEPEKFEKRSDIKFGKDGKPFFVAGPYDNVKKIIKTLESKLGSDNFNFLIMDR
ncbi:MAG: hypothetical protein ACPL7B_10435 [Candidatus Poribacteria bacterium]